MPESRRERVERLVDQLGPVIEGDDGDLTHRSVFERPSRQPGRDLLDPVLHPVDHAEGVLHVPRDHHATDGGGARVVQGTAPVGGTERHPGDIAYSDGRMVAGRHDGLLELARFLDEPEPANEVLDAVDFDRARADVEVGFPDGVGHLHERDAVGAHRFGVDIDLILADVAADGRHLADPLHALKGVADDPILDGPKLVLVPAPDDVAVFVAALERVPKHLPERRRVGPEGGRHSLGYRAGWQRRQLLENPRAGPVEVDAIVEDDVDGGEPERRRATDGPDARDSEERRRQRVGDLILDVARRSPGPLGEHDLLVLSDVRDRVDRDRVRRKRPEVLPERRDVDRRLRSASPSSRRRRTSGRRTSRRASPRSRASCPWRSLNAGVPPAGAPRASVRRQAS